MKGRFLVTFNDGSSAELEAETADAAKTAAKNAAYTKLDPGGNLPLADRRSHPSVLVQSVKELGTAAIGLGLMLLTGWIASWLEAQIGGAPAGVLTAGVLTLFAAKGTAINTTIAALAAVTGDSLTVPHFPDTKKAWLLQVWADVQLAGTLRIRSPKMHDNVNGIRVATIASDVVPLLPWGVKSPLYPGEVLAVELAGSSTGGDEEFICLLAYFEELSAQHSKLISADEAIARTMNLITVENSITTLTTGVWTGAEAINAEIDQFQHNDEYAILGYKVSAECAAIRYRAPDFANVGLGGPGVETDPELLADWFLRISRAYSLPLVPVFNSANKASVFIEALQDENGTDVVVSTYLARLRKG